jgi:hypothetical protein
MQKIVCLVEDGAVSLNISSISVACGDVVMMMLHCRHL